MSIDIVTLIENNPITKLDHNYQSKLIEKVKTIFSSYEHQLFIASFYCYLNYNTNDFIINLDDVWKWIGFNQKVKAKVLLENNFVINVDYKKTLYSELSQSQSPPNNKGGGGRNKEIFTLTVKTFKKFCLKAGTKKSNEIHDYFIKLEDVLHEILVEESNDLKTQLQKTNMELQQLDDKKTKEYQNKLEKQKFIEREKILLREYATIGSLVYIIKVKTFENGDYIIKIGESRKGILNRYNEHKSKYDECLLLDCFLVDKCKDFENFLHNHAQIRGNRVTDYPKHEKELELFLVGKNLSYQTLTNIIAKNIKIYACDVKQLVNENEKLQKMIEIQDYPHQTIVSSKTNNDDLLQVINTLSQVIKELSSKIDNLEQTNKEILNKINESQTKTTTNYNTSLVTLGPRLQRINPDTLTINKVYESIAECLKEYNFKVKRPSIVKAINDNTIYHGYRWAYVDRNSDPNTIANLKETKITKPQNNGYIAKINKEKTEILNVYLDRKTACVYENYKSNSCLDSPVKNNTLYNGYYYMLFDMCNPELKTNFIEKHKGEPILYKNGIGQYNSDNKMTMEFVCKYDCIKQMKFSDKTLAKSLDNNIQYNGFYYKSIGSKLFM